MSKIFKIIWYMARLRDGFAIQEITCDALLIHTVLDHSDEVGVLKWPLN